MKVNWILVVAFAAAAIALFQAYQARRSFTADHERRRKQSTLDAWDTIRTRCQAELALLWEAYKDSPTLNEQGLKGFDVKVWHGVYAPKGTPAEAIQKMNAALRAALQDPAVVTRMRDLGAEIVPESKLTPEGLRTWLKVETERYAPLIKSAGIYAD